MRQLTYSYITLDRVITLVQTEMLLTLKGTVLITETTGVYQDSQTNQDM